MNTQLKRRCVLLCVVLLVFVYALWQDYSRSSNNASAKQIFVPPIALPSGLPSVWLSGYLPKPPVAEVHAANLVVADKQLYAFWYGGSREGSRDTSIYAADWPLETAQPQWQNLRVVMTPERVAQDQQRYIKKIGNAVPYVDKQQVLWLMFVSVSIGGWAGSALNLTHSTDHGFTWAPVQRLVTSPFLNISTLGRSSPLTYQNGDTLWPVYHELFVKFAEGLHLDAQGRVLGKQRISSGQQGGFQPSFLAFDEQQALVLLRSVDDRGQVLMSTTSDAGQSWSTAQALNQDNPDSAIAALALDAQRLIWVYNDAKQSRHILSLGLSPDRGRTWQKLCDVANDPTVEPGFGFSYPSLAQDSSGMIHLVYSEGRQAIRHQRFTQAWLEQAQVHAQQVSGAVGLCSAVLPQAVGL